MMQDQKPGATTEQVREVVKDELRAAPYATSGAMALAVLFSLSSCVNSCQNGDRLKKIEDRLEKQKSSEVTR